MTFDELVDYEAHTGLVEVAHFLARQWKVEPSEFDVKLFDDGTMLPD